MIKKKQYLGDQLGDTTKAMKALYKNNRIHQITVLLPLSWQGVVLSSLWRQSSLWKKNKFNRMFYMCRLYMTADWCHSYGNQLRMTKFTAAWWPCLAILDRELKAKSDSKKTKKGMQRTKLNVRLLIITFFFFSFWNHLNLDEGVLS